MINEERIMQLTNLMDLMKIKATGMSYNNLRLSVLMVLLLLSTSLFSQSIPIQLMVVDADGFEMPNKQVKLRLTLTNDTSNTTGQYQEVHITQTNDFGIVSESIGKGVATTNSSVFGIEQFSFNATEPLIKIELDTSSTSNQYYMIGAITYSYPMVSQRALKADSSSYSLDASNAEYSDTAEFARNSDSSAYSLHASNAEYSDTAEFARNFEESLDNDTSAGNELQDLSYDSSSGDLTISGGNTVNIKQNNELNGVAVLVEEIPNNADLSGWQAADSLFLYKWSSQTLSKAPLSDPTNISSINVGFSILTVSPYDSIVFGVTNNATVYSACGLDGTGVVSKTLSGYPMNIRTHGDTINFFTSTAASQQYHTNKTCYNWLLSSNTISTTFSFLQESYIAGMGTCGNAVSGNTDRLGRFANYFLSSYGGSFFGWECTMYIVDRFTGSTVTTLASINNIDYFSNSGLKHFLLYSSGFIPNGATGNNRERISTFTPRSQLNTGSSNVIKLITGSGTYDKFLGYHDMIGMDNNGQYLFSNIYAQVDNSIGSKEELFIFNSNNIDSAYPITRLLMSDWSISSQLSTGTYYIVEVRDEFLLVLDRVSNFIVNGVLLNGSFIVHIPKN